MSAGFDAAVSDEHLPVGGYRVTSEGYAALTRTLLRATDGKVRLCPRGGTHYVGHLSFTSVAWSGQALFCLEGGYNPTGLGANIEACLTSMLQHSTESQEPPQPPSFGQASEQTLLDVRNVKTCLAPYWACLRG